MPRCETHLDDIDIGATGCHGGDDAAIEETNRRLGPLDQVVTKTSLGFQSAETLTPAAACEAIYQGCDIDPICCLTIKQNVRSGRVHAIASAYLRAFPTWRRTIGHDRNILPELACVRLGSIESPAIHRVIPDFVEVRLGARGEDKVTGHQSFNVCCRFRATRIQNHLMRSPCTSQTSEAESGPISIRRGNN